MPQDRRVTALGGAGAGRRWDRAWRLENRGSGCRPQPRLPASVSFLVMDMGAPPLLIGRLICSSLVVSDNLGPIHARGRPPPKWRRKLVLAVAWRASNALVQRMVASDFGPHSYEQNASMKRRTALGILVAAALTAPSSGKATAVEPCSGMLRSAGQIGEENWIKQCAQAQHGYQGASFDNLTGCRRTLERCKRNPRGPSPTL